MLTCEQLLSQCVLLIIRLMVHRWAALHPRASLKYETFPLTMKRREPYTGHIKSLRGDAPASLQDKKVTVEFFGLCIFGFLSDTTVRKKVKLQM